MRRKQLSYYHNVTSGSNGMRDVHWCVTVFYQQIENGNIANQIQGFTTDYGKFVLKYNSILVVIKDYESAFHAVSLIQIP